jgi:CubicO group peptidase (beta-lactamase class C family)
LIEQGKLSFDTPVSEYFPELKDLAIPDDPELGPGTSFEIAKQTMTINHLFTHTSGLSYFLGPARPAHSQTPLYIPDYDPEKKYEQFFDVLKGNGKYRRIPVTFEPGSDCKSDSHRR